MTAADEMQAMAEAGAQASEAWDRLAAAQAMLPLADQARSRSLYVTTLHANIKLARDYAAACERLLEHQGE